MATVSDLEYLLKEKVVTVLKGAALYLEVLEAAQNLREDNNGNTIAQIFSSNPYWVDEEVAVLPSPLAEDQPKRVVVELDLALKNSELKIVYYNAFEVRDFRKSL